MRPPFSLLAFPIFLVACTDDNRESRPSIAAGEPADHDACVVVTRIETALGQPVPNLLSRESARGSTAQPADISLPLDASGATRVRDRASGVEASFRIVGAKPVPSSRTDQLVVYRAAVGDAGGFDGSLIQRQFDEGTEDFVFFEHAPRDEALTYHVDLDSAVAGLRLVADTLELLDRDGVPRLRLAPPYVLSPDSGGGIRGVPARVSVRGCRIDTRTAGPWGRSVLAPGSRSCEVVVSWVGAGVAYPALVDPAWTTTGSMTTPRSFHALVLLTDGRVIAIGGDSAIKAPLASTEIFDPATGTWAATASMAYARDGRGASVRLLDGRILVAGNGSGAALTSAEVYDPASPTPSWQPAGTLAQPHSGHTTTLLASGKVLVAGGSSQTAEVFDPNASGNPWSPAGTMIFQRSVATAALLPDGRVVVAGGAVGGNPNATAEKYDPAAAGNPWSTTLSPMAVGRYDASSAIVNGKMFVVGGANTTNVDVFDPATDKFSSGPSLSSNANSSRTVKLVSGELVLANATNNAPQLYDPAAQKWWSLTSQAFQSGFAATPLSDGRALFSGGGISPMSASAVLFDPSSPGAFFGGFCSTGTQCKGGTCLNSVCCDAPCSGCMACLESYTGQPSGHCAPVLAGKDPNNACSDYGSPSCTYDGLCDGAGACEKYPTSTGCTPKPCWSNSECQSQFCVDGVCCENACTGTCKACSAAAKGQGIDGVCSFIADGLDPQSECSTIGSGVCAGNGVCNGAGQCRSPNAGNVCAPSSCVGLDAQNNPSTCSAGGSCTSNGISSCYPYVCSGFACLTTCTTSADCALGIVCIGGQCNAPKANGLPCALGTECKSGVCVEGVCCDSSCDAQCDSCLAANKVSGSSGTCGPRKAGAVCGTASCINPTTLSVGSCNGLGSCVSNLVPCAPYACVGGACATTCSTAAECAPPNVCKSGACVAPDAGASDAASDTGSPDVVVQDATNPDAPSDSGSDATDAPVTPPDAIVDAAGGVAGFAGSSGSAGLAGSAGIGGNATGGAGGVSFGGNGGTGGLGGSNAGGVSAGGSSGASDASTDGGKVDVSSDDGGCGCRQVGSSRPSTLALLVVGVLVARRRRARDRSARSS